MKKKINIVLICAVLSLWGTVIYRSVNNYLVKNDGFARSEKFSMHDFKIVAKDTFELSRLSYDPFLQKPYSTKAKSEKGAAISNIPLQKRKVKVEAASNNNTFAFPSIKYYGFIKSVDKKDELVILKINDRLRKVRANESFDGLKVKKIYKDSIVISNNVQSRTFSRT